MSKPNTNNQSVNLKKDKDAPANTNEQDKEQTSLTETTKTHLATNPPPNTLSPAPVIVKNKISKVGVLALLLSLLTMGGVAGLAGLGWLGYLQLDRINSQLATTANEAKIDQAMRGLASKQEVALQQQQLDYQKQQTEQNQRQGQQLQQESNQIKGQVSELATHLEGKIAAQTSDITQLNKAFKDLSLPQLNLRQLTEVEFLLERAEVYLQQLNEPQAATQLVELAHSSIKKIKLSHKSKLLAQLEADLDALTSLNVNSRMKATQQLNQLALVPDKLVNFQPPVGNQPKPVVATNEAWYLQAWQEIKNLITIKQLNEELKVLPFSQQEEALKQQISALLYQAAAAASLGKQDLYDLCLAEVQTRLKLFASSSVATQLAQDLSGLQGINLNPELPSLQSSLDELNKLQASINSQPEV